MDGAATSRRLQQGEFLLCGAPRWRGGATVLTPINRPGKPDWRTMGKWGGRFQIA